jgi:molybdopterin/thiamine biosynthesis adenylyltransferase
MIPGFGIEGQEKLQRAHVFIAGMGGLGSPIALYLAAAGVGSITLVDMDRVDLSNLNRQILHWDDDVGKQKVRSALEKLRKVNPSVKCEPVNTKINEENVLDLTAKCDVLMDATDNFQARYLLNKAAIQHSIPLIHGAVYGYEGRLVTLFPGRTACLECILPHMPPSTTFPVLGTTPGVIAMLQSTEAIKYITGTGVNLTDEMLLYDGEMMKFDRVKISRNPNCTSCATKS